MEYNVFLFLVFPLNIGIFPSVYQFIAWSFIRGHTLVNSYSQINIASPFCLYKQHFCSDISQSFQSSLKALPAFFAVPTLISYY